jgi:hypothetical protein
VSNISPFAAILINSSLLPNKLAISQNTTGRADVLDILMPKLSLTYPSKPTLYLPQVDDYMLLETKQLLQRIAVLFKRLGLGNGEYEVRFEFEKLSFNSNEQDVSALTALVNLDKWSVGALAWLQPNYQGLVYSIELQQFAALYQQNSTKALEYYHHIGQAHYDLRCKLNCCSNTLTLHWETPIQCFYLPSS